MQNNFMLAIYLWHHYVKVCEQAQCQTFGNDAINLHVYSRAMKTQQPNVHRYLNDILYIISQRIYGNFMNTKDKHHIDFISFKVKLSNVYTHAYCPTVVK